MLAVVELPVGLRGANFVLFPHFLLCFFFFSSGLDEYVWFSLAVCLLLAPSFGGKWLTDCFSSPALRSCKSYFIQTSITGT